MIKITEYRYRTIFKEVKGWKCILCDKFYRTDDLVNEILTVWAIFCAFDGTYLWWYLL